MRSSNGEFYDAIALPNLYGDLLSDLCAGLIGGLGAAPAPTSAKTPRSSKRRTEARQIQGAQQVNPCALILSGVLMLRHLKETEAADRLENAIAEVILEGKDVTYDLKPHRDDPTAVGTKQMADAICKKMR